MRIRFLILMVLLFSLVLTACDVDQPPDPTPTPLPTSDSFNPASVEEQLRAFAELKGVLPTVGDSMENCQGGMVCDLIQDGFTVDPSTMNTPGWFLSVRKDGDINVEMILYWAESGQAVLDDGALWVWPLTSTENDDLWATGLYETRYLRPSGGDKCRFAWDSNGDPKEGDTTVTFYFPSGPNLEVPAYLVPEGYERGSCYQVCGNQSMWEQEPSTTSEDRFDMEAIRADASFVTYEIFCEQ